MKVKDIKPERLRISNTFEELQKLESILKNDKALCNKIQGMYDAKIPLEQVIVSARMKYCELIMEIDERIDNSELAQPIKKE